MLENNTFTVLPNNYIMETISIDNDIHVFYVPATSFPDGILAAHQQLHSLVPFSTSRRYFGISRPEDGEIRYKAAAEELEHGEAEKFNCQTLVLKKGNYTSETVYDYARDEQLIAKAFERLLEHRDLDPLGYCVEWYISAKDVRCMIRLKE